MITIGRFNALIAARIVPDYTVRLIHREEEIGTFIPVKR